MEEREISIEFPNLSRSYDPAHGRVRFWGYDSAMEVSFLLENEALRLMSPGLPTEEGAILRAFDANRDRIMQTARRVYSPRHNGAIILSARNFSG